MRPGGRTATRLVAGSTLFEDLRVRGEDQVDGPLRPNALDGVPLADPCFLSLVFRGNATTFTPDSPVNLHEVLGHLCLHRTDEH